MKKVDVSKIFEHPPLSIQEKHSELYSTIKRLKQNSSHRSIGILQKCSLYMISCTEAWGGAVSELIPSMIYILEELGFDAEWWIVIPQQQYKEEYYKLTRKICNFMCGKNPLHLDVAFSEEEQHLYLEVMRKNAEPLLNKLKKGDIVMVHDPHPLPIVNFIRERFSATEVPCIWRQYAGSNLQTEETKAVWEFLQPYLEKYSMNEFSDLDHSQPFCKNARQLLPMISPLNEKNKNLSPLEMKRILTYAGLLRENSKYKIVDEQSGNTFHQQVTIFNYQKKQYLVPIQYDKNMSTKLSLSDISNNTNHISKSQPATYNYWVDEIGLEDRPFLLQIGQWESVNGYEQILDGFIDLKQNPTKYIDQNCKTKLDMLDGMALILTGPHSKLEDTESLCLVKQLEQKILNLPEKLQRDVILMMLPTLNRGESSLIINSLQRYCYAVVQNSLRQGIGQSILEGMWKGKVCLSSIHNKMIKDGENGLIITDPCSTQCIAETIAKLLLAKSDQIKTWQLNAKTTVIQNYLIYSQVQKLIDHLQEINSVVRPQRRGTNLLDRKDSFEANYLARLDILSLLNNNRKYVEKMLRKDPQFFKNLENIQTPEYLYIGCSDSRVPANEILGLMPGEVFVHRNIAGLVIQSDFNMLSVLHYAVDYLKVKHVIVCGHYECGGVKASLSKDQNLGLFQNWTKHIGDLYNFYQKELSVLPEKKMHDQLCELNVMWQVKNLSQTTVVQSAWARKQTLHVHGLIFDVKDGLLMDMGIHLDNQSHADKFRDNVWSKRFQPQCKSIVLDFDDMSEDILRNMANQIYF